ncbi:ATP-binding cassette domain-containing protein [Floricoccus penangensis]|uniref:ATP-binding cassette domain-containing protein n=1 Tax=Floricoccus penangensis TaxID=1859475 RepID=UPI00204267CF|nr:ABC transporter ATP-binding protein [Floricoccus penangensis]URZ86721.1 ABC transporter ATP-binding protein/permease [Floricoccus penangensis]
MYSIFKYLDKKTKFLTIIGAISNGGLALASPLIVSRALSLDQGNLTYQKIFQFAIYGFSVYFILYSLMLFCNHTRNIFKREIQMNIRSALFQRLMINRDYSDDEKITLLTQDMEYLGDSYLTPMVDTIGWAFCALIISIYIVSQNFILGLIFVFFTILRPIPQAILNNKIKNTGDEMSTKRSDVHAKVSDSIHGSQTLLMNQALEKNSERIYQANSLYHRAIQKFNFTNNFIFFCNGFMVFLSQVLPLVLGFYFAMKGHAIPIASLIAMYIASNQLVGPIQTIMYNVVYIQGAKAVADKVFNVLDIPLDNKEIEDDFRKIASLQIENLSKQYNGRTLFKKFKFDISSGQKVLIKGASGSGKSTLIRIIASLEVPDEGEIKCFDAEKEQLNDYRKQVGMISQSPFLFNDTIRYNLSLGQEFSDEKLLEVLKMVKLDNEIDDILNFKIYNNGENVSGGQRVRIELARFLIREKEILLADEVTAALDPTNGKMVRELLFSLPVMVLEIAHHIDDEDRYDQIINLDKFKL